MGKNLSKTRYVNCKLYLENGKIINDGCIEIENGIITKIFDKYQKLPNDIDLKKNIVIPGFIDLQCNGGFGVSFLGVDDKGMNTFDKNIFKTGCTNYLSTLITDIPERYKNSIVSIKKYLKENNDSPCLGIHLEGPFLNPLKKGAHNPKYIVEGTIDRFKKYYNLSEGKVKEITFAPEKTNTEVTKFAVSKNVLVCAGHSMANYEDVIKHKKFGLISCTHLFNAMAPVNHQHPNLIECFLNEDDLYCQIICDKLHIDPRVIEIVWRIKDVNKLVLVTDAIVAMGLKDGQYTLGTMEVISKNGRACLKSDNNMLAGSVLTMIKAIQNMHEITNCSIHDIIKMSATNPSKLLKLDNKLGTIAKNKIANLVVLNNKLELVYTIYHGNIVYENK